jgi:hypothetical protein
MTTNGGNLMKTEEMYGGEYSIIRNAAGIFSDAVHAITNRRRSKQSRELKFPAQRKLYNCFIKQATNQNTK